MVARRKTGAQSKSVATPKPVVDPAKLILAPRPIRIPKLHTVRISAAEAGTTAPEPDFTKITDLAVGETKHQRLALNWYNYTADEDDALKFFEEWIRAYHPTEADARIKKLNRIAKDTLNRTWGAMARMTLRGYPLSQYYYDQIETYMLGLLTIPQKEKTTETDISKKSVPNIQDRIRDQVRPVLAEIDHFTDCLLDGESVDKDKIQTLIANPNFKAAHLQMIGRHITHYLTEWQQATLAKLGKVEEEHPDTQLAEGYSYLTTRQLKRATEALHELFTLVKGTTEAVKPVRKRRPRTTESIVKKLKYKPECPELGLVSIDPKEILGASVLWVFNCKRRKLGMYVGEHAGSIDLKRSTLLGVNEGASGFKTLRKPEEQLKEFLKLRKGSGQKFFDKIRAKARPARCRINTETLILRAE